MCFSVLALYCKQSKMGVKSSREQWLKKVKCAAGLVKIWVGRVSNAFCEQALSQNSFFRPSCFAPFPKRGCPSGTGRKLPLFPTRNFRLCFVLRLGLHLGDLACNPARTAAARAGRRGARQLPVPEINEPLSSAAAPRGPPPPRTWPDSCVVAGVRAGCWALDG